jgi:hypothetical protein
VVGSLYQQSLTIAQRLADADPTNVVYSADVARIEQALENLQ